MILVPFLKIYIVMRDRCVLQVNAGVASFERGERVLQYYLLRFFLRNYAPGHLFHELRCLVGTAPSCFIILAAYLNIAMDRFKYLYIIIEKELFNIF